MLLTNARKTDVNNEADVLKGLTAGTIGGLVASWLMEEVQTVWLKASEALQQSQGLSIETVSEASSDFLPL
jgi:hypothetical protein